MSRVTARGSDAAVIMNDTIQLVESSIDVFVAVVCLETDDRL